MGARDPSPCLRVMASQKRNVGRANTLGGHEGVTALLLWTPAGRAPAAHRHLRPGAPNTSSLSGNARCARALDRRPARARLVARQARCASAHDRLDAISKAHAAQTRRRHHLACSCDNANTRRSRRRFPLMHAVSLRPIGHPSIRPAHHLTDLRRGTHRHGGGDRPHPRFNLTRGRSQLRCHRRRRVDTFRRLPRGRHTRCRCLVFTASREPRHQKGAAQACQRCKSQVAHGSLGTRTAERGGRRSVNVCRGHRCKANRHAA